MPARALLNLARVHWFVPLAPLLLLLETGFARSTDWSRAGPAEAAILFDLCLFAPFLYWLCYRRRLAGPALLMRAAALSLLGIYLASQLVPADAQQLLPRLSWLRTAGFAVLILIELRLFAAILKMVLAGEASAEQVATRGGTPIWVARLMLLEARFWRALWRLIRGR
jgi:hypothetical protein